VPPAIGSCTNTEQDILTHQSAWESLSPTDRQEILALFPDSRHILNQGTPDAIPDIISLMSDDNFRHDCARYSENIAQGRHDEEWLAQAWAAHERRAAGDFDDFLARKFADDWGVEVPDHLKPRRAGGTGPMEGVEGSGTPLANDGVTGGAAGTSATSPVGDSDASAQDAVAMPAGKLESDDMDVDA